MKCHFIRKFGPSIYISFKFITILNAYFKQGLIYCFNFPYSCSTNKINKLNPLFSVLIKSKRDVSLQVYLVITLKKVVHIFRILIFLNCICIDTNRTHYFDNYIIIKLYDFFIKTSIFPIHFILKLIMYLNNH